MRNSLIFPLIFFISSLYANELAWVDKQIEAIKPPRVGVSNELLLSLVNPFIFFKESNSTEDIVGIKDITPQKKIIPKKIDKKRRYTKKRTKPRTYYSYKGVTLHAIMNKSALINSKWYKIGEKILGFKIKSITRTSVILIRKKKTLILSTKSKIKTLNFKK
ncbi:MAG: hypothetical protein U9P38_08530 [Campylobacterota bacterium]|nr:hypothetical protein [Campylobacterota bacterium]